MSLLSNLRLSRIRENVIFAIQCVRQAQHAAGDKKTPKTSKEKIHLPVESNVNKLLTYVCGTNIYKEGEDVKLKPDSEYPEWLWSIRTEPKKFEDLDPNTKEYWKYIRKQALRRNNLMKKHQKF